MSAVQDNQDLTVIDQEFYDTMQHLNQNGRRKKPAESVLFVLPVDRSDARWKRMRASLCPESGLGGPDALDEYCDRVYRLVPR